MTWRNTTILTLNNSMVIVPNSKLAQAIITNFSLPEGWVSLSVPVGVSYGSDLDQVERIALEIGREIMAEFPGGISEFEPAVRCQAFGDSSINFSVALGAGAFADQYQLRHEFLKRLKRRFEA